MEWERPKIASKNWKYQGNISCMMGTIKDRKGKDLKEAEIKRRWKEYTEELYNHNGVVTHPETDILVCEVKWTLQSITWSKVNGGDEIPDELFQTLKADAAFNMWAHLENSEVATGMENIWVFFPNPKEEQCQRMFKLPYNRAYFMC